MNSQTTGSFTFIHTGGDPTTTWNLVLLSEGYTQQDHDDQKWESDAASFAAVLKNTAPFSEVAIQPRFNIVRVDAVSAQSGADDPLQCHGSGARSATMFDASYCNFNLRRLLKVNEYLVRTTLAQVVPWRHKVLVVVNDPAASGGSGGPIAVIANGPNWQAIAVHELGHSFGLADEYDYYRGCGHDVPGHNHYDTHDPEPICPNISKNDDINTVKWLQHVTDPLTAPVFKSTNCLSCSRVLLREARVGIFEGAAFHHCGIYRPAFRCKMRKFTTPYFCVVCADHIRQTLMAFGPQGS